MENQELNLGLNQRPIDEKLNWNEYFYSVYSLLNSRCQNKTKEITLPAKAIPAYLAHDYEKID